jgi:hypothetical protein
VKKTSTELQPSAAYALDVLRLARAAARYTSYYETISLPYVQGVCETPIIRSVSERNDNGRWRRCPGPPNSLHFTARQQNFNFDKKKLESSRGLFRNFRGRFFLIDQLPSPTQWTTVFVCRKPNRSIGFAKDAVILWNRLEHLSNCRGGCPLPRRCRRRRLGESLHRTTSWQCWKRFRKKKLLAKNRR